MLYLPPANEKGLSRYKSVMKAPANYAHRVLKNQQCPNKFVSFLLPFFEIGVGYISIFVSPLTWFYFFQKNSNNLILNGYICFLVAFFRQRFYCNDESGGKI